MYIVRRAARVDADDAVAPGPAAQDRRLVRCCDALELVEGFEAIADGAAGFDAAEARLGREVEHHHGRSGRKLGVERPYAVEPERLRLVGEAGEEVPVREHDLPARQRGFTTRSR